MGRWHVPGACKGVGLLDGGLLGFGFIGPEEALALNESKSGAKHLSNRIKQLIEALEYYKEIYSTLEKDMV